MKVYFFTMPSEQEPFTYLVVGNDVKHCATFIKQRGAWKNLSLSEIESLIKQGEEFPLHPDYQGKAGIHQGFRMA